MLSKRRKLASYIGAGVAPGGGGGVVPPLPSTDYFAINGATQPWYSSATGPNIVYDPTGNKTYIVWMSYSIILNGKTTHIRAYDHTLGAWEPSVAVGRGQLVKNDDHGVPAIVIDSNGYIMVVYGEHNASIYTAVSKQPRKIDGGFNEYTIQPSKATYWRPVARANGVVDIFYRYDNGSSNGKMDLRHRALTITNGTINSGVGAETLVGEMGADSRWYSGDTILRPDGLIWQVSTRANYTDDYRKDVFIFRFDTAAKTVTNHDGSVTVAWPVAQANLASFRVYQHSAALNVTGNIPGMAFDDAGRIHISTNSGGTAGSGGTNNLSDAEMFHIIIASGVVGFPFKVADLDQRYESGRCVPLSGGRMGLYYPTKEGLRGGDIARRILPANDNGSGLGAEEIIYTRPRGKALNEISCPQVAHPNFRIAFGEIVPTSIDSSGYVPGWLFAHGDAGILKSKLRQGGATPAGTAFLYDFTKAANLAAATDGTGAIAEGTAVAYVADLSGNGNNLVRVGTDSVTYWRELAPTFGFMQLGYRQFSNETPQNQAFMANNVDLIRSDGFCLTVALGVQSTDGTRHIVAMDKGAGDGTQRQFSLRYDMGLGRLVLNGVTSTGTAFNVDGTITGLIKTGQAIVAQVHYNGATIVVYVNGVQVLTTTRTLSPTPNPLYVGADNANLTTTSIMQGDMCVIFGRAGAVSAVQRDADLVWAQSKMFAA